MDDRGFVFTTDAILALVVFFIFAASIATYYTLPSYMGADHQHLESQAADALQVMTYDGTLYSAAAQLASNNTTVQAKGRANLTTELEYLLNGNGTDNRTSYKLSMTLDNGSVATVENNKTATVSKDTVTRVVVLSGPKQGWLGRAWYKLEEVKFNDQRINSTTTLWNFHNWLTNFSPWRGTNGGQLGTYYYWGSATGSPAVNIPISFSFPNNATIYNAIYLLGSANKTNVANPRAFGANVTINGNIYSVNNTNFTSLYSRGTSPQYNMFNYKGSVPSTQLNPGGSNSFFVRFTNASNWASSSLAGHDMPWFSVIGNYSTTIPVPEGIITQTFDAPDSAGWAVPNPNGYAGSYNLNTGVITNYTGERSINWASMVNQNFTYSNGIPFDILNLPSGDKGCAVSTTHDVIIPAGASIKDAYTVLNSYGGVDSTLVEVWNGSTWNTVFNSFNFTSPLNGTNYGFSSRSDGYGNTPGILYIGNYLKSGTTNKVRITVWDNVPSTDYDMVGMVDSYTTVSYTALPISWVNFPFKSYQYPTNSSISGSTFSVGNGAEKIFMFFGTGLDTRKVAVQVKNTTSSTWKTIYNSTTIPFVLDIGDLDLNASMGAPVFTSGTVGNYTGINGNYDVRLFIESSSSWQSGDFGGTSSTYQTYSNSEVYSGTRIGVVYPKFLDNLWAADFADNPTTAQQLAFDNLTDALSNSNITFNASNIKTEALYTGNLPNSITIRLDLWRD